MKKIVFIFLGWVFCASASSALASQPTDYSDQLSNATISTFVSGFSSTANNISNIDTSNFYVGDTIYAFFDDGSAISYDGYSNPIIKVYSSSLDLDISSRNFPFNYPNTVYISKINLATHTVKFTPSANSTTPWQFLIKSTLSNSIDNFNDANNRANYEGFVNYGVGITCPSAWTSSVASVGDTVILSDYEAGGTGRGGTYLNMSCSAPSGTGTSQATITIRNLINPASSGKFPYLIRHLDGLDNVIYGDTVAGEVVIPTNNVRVSASVDKILTFQIDSVGTVAPNTNLCSGTLSPAASNTTATAVPFGNLTLNAFHNLAQHISLKTNNPGGYVITAYETQPLTSTIGITLPNVSGVGTSGTWTTQAINNSGFGYALQAGATITDVNSVGIGATNIFKPFSDDAFNPDIIMSHDAPNTVTDNAFVCYRVAAAYSQPFGAYENAINYVATVNF
ncbi:MAG: hypothetical protein WCG91_03935 [Candidatus Shapirobacteria bacterium]